MALETELLERLREIEASRPPDGCKLMEFLRYLGRRSEVEVEIRKIREKVGNGSASPTVYPT